MFSMLYRLTIIIISNTFDNVTNTRLPINPTSMTEATVLDLLLFRYLLFLLIVLYGSVLDDINAT